MGIEMGTDLHGIIADLTRLPLGENRHGRHETKLHFGMTVAGHPV